MKAIMFGYNGNVDMNQFDFDLCFLQRYSKNHLNKLKYQNHYVHNYGERGLCIVSKDIPLNIQSGQFNDYVVEVEDDCQGQYWQTLSIGKYKIINSSVSFPSNEMPTSVYFSQGKQLLDMMDDNTIIVTDLHSEDNDIEEDKVLSFKNRNLKNHLSTFKTYIKNGEMSLDKIITTKNSSIVISNINVIKCEKETPTGHWPISFDIKY